MKHRPLASLAFCLVALTASLAGQSRPAPVGSRPSEPRAAWSDAQQKGLVFLLAQQKDGAFEAGGRQGARPDVGLTALASAAMQTKPRELRSEAEQKAIDAALAWLLARQDKDGSFGGQVPNYNTCACVQAMMMSGEARFAEAVKRAQRFVLGIQHTEARNYAKSDPDYGSIGYGGREDRGDLSNLSFAVEALRASGLAAQDEAIQKAVVFLQRTQNLRAVNDAATKSQDEQTKQPVVTESGDDGGAIYYPGNSPMGYVETSDGKRVARSYGSMTYALLKAYLLAGVPADDPRVQAAVKWIEKNWTVEHNPGADPRLPEKTKYSGLFYQYMLMARALQLAGLDTVQPERDGKRATIDWRKELRAQLLGLQRADGSWVNTKDDRWWEGLPLLATAYALLALQHC